MMVLTSGDPFGSIEEARRLISTTPTVKVTKSDFGGLIVPLADALSRDKKSLDRGCAA